MAEGHSAGSADQAEAWWRRCPISMTSGKGGRPVDDFGPSNIIRRDGYWYVFIFAESYGAQRRGACLLRSDNIEDPTSWRAWDGQDFTIAFVDPYVDAAFQPGLTVSGMPVPGLSSTISSVSRLPGADG